IWQRKYFTGKCLEKQINYWKNRLDNFESLELHPDNPRPMQVDYKGDDYSFFLDKHTSKLLRQLSRALEVSLYTVLLSAYYLMLRVFSNQDDIVIGTPVANRHYHQVENL